MKPAIVLVHAAWADASSWHKVIVPLQKEGYQVIGAQLPLTSLQDDIAAVRREISLLQGPVVLAGHSYGGAVVSGAARGEPKVKGLAIIAGLAPEEGEVLGALLHRDNPNPPAASAAPDAAGFIRLPLGVFLHSAAPDSTPEEAALKHAVQRPISVRCIAEPMPAVGWREIPSWFLVAERDRMISPATQRFMAGRMRATTSEAPVDHDPLSSAPKEVLRVILEAAAAVR